MLRMAQTPSFQGRLKRFVLAGYASPKGAYLHNCNLSLEQSQRAQ